MDPDLPTLRRRRKASSRGEEEPLISIHDAAQSASAALIPQSERSPALPRRGPNKPPTPPLRSRPPRRDRPPSPPSAELPPALQSDGDRHDSGHHDVLVVEIDTDRALVPLPDYLAYKTVRVRAIDASGRLGDLRIEVCALLTLQIPAGAAICRSESGRNVIPSRMPLEDGRKYCASRARVTAVQFCGEIRDVCQTLTEYQRRSVVLCSNYDSTFLYRLNRVVAADVRPPNPGHRDCASGIHFYMDKGSALEFLRPSGSVAMFPTISKRLTDAEGFAGTAPAARTPLAGWSARTAAPFEVALADYPKTMWWRPAPSEQAPDAEVPRVVFGMVQAACAKARAPVRT